MLIPYLKSLSGSIRQHEIYSPTDKTRREGIEISNCPQHLALSNPTNGPHPEPPTTIPRPGKTNNDFLEAGRHKVDKCPGAG